MDYLESQLGIRNHEFKRFSKDEIELGASVNEVFTPRPIPRDILGNLRWGVAGEVYLQEAKSVGADDLIRSQTGNLGIICSSFYDCGREGIYIFSSEEDIWSSNLQIEGRVNDWIGLAREGNPLYVSGLIQLKNVLETPDISNEKKIDETLDFMENHSHL